jgi:hypothetical protein
MPQLEARYHRLQLVDPGIVNRPIQTYACVILCGCGSCGDELADVRLTVGGDHLRIDVRPGYSQVPIGAWRWSRHARRSYRGAASHAPRLPKNPGCQRLVTKHGDQVVVGRH